MRKLLGILGLFIGLTAIKAALGIGQHGAPPSLRPKTIGDWIGLGFVVILVFTFVICLIGHLIRDKTADRSETDLH